MAYLPFLMHQLKEVPEYFLALKAALAVLASGVPIYFGIRYFLYRRRLTMPLQFHLEYLSSFFLFAGLAFLYASPLASHLHPAIVSAYLFITCLFGSFGLMMLMDAFLVQHYLCNVRKVYISPPLRTIIRLALFLLFIFPSLHYALHFNPFTLIAIPTIATAGIALALQDTLKTFIAGLGLAKVVRLGEWIGFQGKDGQVVDINWARTVLRTADGNYIYIPNSLLQTGIFVNYSAVSPESRIALKVGASYDISPSRVKEVLSQCVKDVPGVISNPAPLVTVQEYGDSAINYGVYVWVNDFSIIPSVQDDVSTRIWYAFRREGIEIPYPIRTLYVHEPVPPAPQNGKGVQN